MRLLRFARNDTLSIAFLTFPETSKYFVDATQFCIIMGLLYGHRILLQKVNLARLGCKSVRLRRSGLRLGASYILFFPAIY